jgi:alkaline phosphatase D
MTAPRAPELTRRRALQVGGVLTTAAVVGGASGTSPAAAGTGPVFGHGVASGDPLPDGVLLWTRVTPTPQATPGSGVGPDAAVAWEVAADAGFRRVVRRGTARTGAARDHTVKVDVGGLAPATTYWYRFTSGGRTSPVGRTRTAPAPGADVARLRMAVVSCANLQAGWFSAYRHLAARRDLDLVVHLGDYLYEYAPGQYQARNVVVRPHDPPREIVDLADYRRRHAQYKADPDLQALHAAAPWIVTWDDHESANDAWSGGAENHTEGPVEGAWATRQAASQQAYAEWMPVRYEPGGHLYRRFTFGRLASLSMLDLRTYRDRQVSSPSDPALADESRTITGPEQLDFLLDGLADPAVQWKLVGNPVMIAPVRFPNTLDTASLTGVAELIGQQTPAVTGVPYNVDQWDGYPADRARVVGLLRDRGITDAVFLTGDIHSAWAAELPADALTYPATGDSVGVELVCTSVTSDNLDDLVGSPPGTTSRAVEAAIIAANPHVKHLDFDSHGFSVLEVTPAAAQMDWFVLADRTDRASAAVWSTSYTVPAGSRRIRRAAGRLA